MQSCFIWDKVLKKIRMFYTLHEVLKVMLNSSRVAELSSSLAVSVDLQVVDQCISNDVRFVQCSSFYGLDNVYFYGYCLKAVTRTCSVFIKMVTRNTSVYDFWNAYVYLG